MVPRIGSPKPVFSNRLRIAILMVVGVLVLFGFYLANIPPPAGLGSLQFN
jgi:rhomboid protease GluP